MKRLISTKQDNLNYVYHGTHSKQSADNIINNGFNTNEVDFSEVRYDAEGYGRYIIKAQLDDILNNLTIYDMNEYRSFNPLDYGEDCDGIRELSHAEFGKFIYYIFNVPKLNSVCSWSYDGER